MSNYAITATLTAIDNFSSVFQKAGNAVQNFGSSAQTHLATVGKATTAAGAATTAMGMTAVKSFGDFQSSLNQAAVIAGGSAKDIDGLSDVANRMGAVLPLNANQCAEAMVNMARNGASIDDIKQEFPAIAEASTAAGEDINTTAGVVQEAMNIWKGSLQSPQQAAAILVQTANASNASIGDMQQALATIGPTANMAGMDMQTTATAIGLLTNHGFSAAQASDDLNHAITQMLAPSKVAKKEMDELGLSFTDSSGKMKPFPQILQEIASKTDTMGDAQKTAALKTMFGASGMKAIAPLLDAVRDKSGSVTTSWDAFSGAMDKAAGNTERATKTLSSQANEMQQNIGSKIEQVGGNWDDLTKKSLAAKSGVTGSLLDMVNKTLSWAAQSNSSTAQVIRGFIGLSPAIGPAITAVGGFITNFGKIAGTVGKGITAIGNFGKGTIKVTKNLISLRNGTKTLEELSKDSKLAATAMRAQSVATTLASNSTKIFGIALKALQFVGIVAAIAAVVAALTLFFTKTQLGRQIWQNFTNFLKTCWNGIKSTAISVWNGIGNFLRQVWQNTVNTAKPIWNALKNVFTSVWNAIKAVTQLVWGVIRGLLFGQWQGIQQKAQTAFKAIQQIIQSVWNFIRTTTTTIWNGIKTFLMSTWNVIKTIGTTVWYGIKQAVSLVWNAIKSVTMTVWNGIKTFLMALWNGLKTNAGIVWNAIKSVVTNVWNGIKSFTSSIWNGIKSFLMNNWGLTRTQANQVFNAIKQVVTLSWNNIKTITSAVWNGIRSTVSNVWNNLKSMASGVFNAIKSTVQGVWNGIKSITSGIWNAIKSLLTGNWNGLKSSSNSIFNGIRQVISSVWNGVRGVTSSVWNGIKGTLSSIWSGIRSTASSAFNGIRSNISSTMSSLVSNVGSSARSMMSRFSSAVRSGGSNAISAARNVAHNIVSGIRNGMSGLYGAAVDAMQGLVNGVIQMGQQAINAAVNIAHSIVSTIRSALDIHSPSRVMRDEVGVWIPAGVAVGMEKNVGTVTRAADSISNAAMVTIPEANTDKFTRSLKAVKNASQDMLNGGELDNKYSINVNKQPAHIVLSMGGSTYGAFVDDISNQQGNTARLKQNYRI